MWEQSAGFLTPLRWTNISFFTLLHILAFVVPVYNFSQDIYPKWQSWIFFFVVSQIAGFGVTGGVHRYWCHRSYKAKMPLQIILMLCYSVAGQNNIYRWVRDHRVHHKFSETDADPHNVRRGFFFSHIGWLMMKHHPAVMRESAKMDMSDISGDPLVQFHTKYFKQFKLVFCFVLPTLIPVLVWNECWSSAMLTQLVWRYLYTLHATWSVNSFAHLWGHKPYNRHIMPSENRYVSVFAMGEGWHNYHHSFPWDYKAAELAYWINITTLLLDLFAHLGWTYDLKQASPDLVRSMAKNKGDPVKEP